MRRNQLIDIYVIFVSLVAVVASIDALRLHRRQMDMERQLEEEKAYNHDANSKLRQLRKDGVTLVDKLNELTSRYNRLYARYTEFTREQLAENYVIVHRNIRKESKSGN
jgi:predicted nuclease with TOPRIM domain